MVQTLQIVQELVDIPLAIDSSVTAAIEAGLKVARGRSLVNSITGEDEKLETILPLVRKYDVPVVAISNDETTSRWTPTGVSRWPRRSWNAPWTTASSPRMSWSIRW